MQIQKQADSNSTSVTDKLVQITNKSIARSVQVLLVLLAWCQSWGMPCQEHAEGRAAWLLLLGAVLNVTQPTAADKN